jgi:hypothetical protein
MSKQNKVNKSNYDQGGRLTPDDMARERKKQTHPINPVRERVTNRVPSTPRRDAPAANRPRSAPEE